jgi:hypothetical protein
MSLKMDFVTKTDALEEYQQRSNEDITFLINKDYACIFMEHKIYFIIYRYS